MGFLKRLLSLGGKKQKKQTRLTAHNTSLSLGPLDEAEHEAAVGRLLRSSSRRFIENAQVNYADLPPLPHPINNVVALPNTSAISLASSSLNTKGSYSVKVHKRKQHSATELPFSNSAVKVATGKKDEDTRELSRELRLRTDPSVVSLVSMYDEHGKLSSDAFSSSPPRPETPALEKDERVQCKRSGSTLRQLLGAPSKTDLDDSEGDISWAERFLAETTSISSHASELIQTPVSPTFPPIDFCCTAADVSITESHHPTISSMDVEISSMNEIELERHRNNPYQVMDPVTPQRASQVFGFLTKSRQSKEPEAAKRARPIPPPSPSEDADSIISDTSIDQVQRALFTDFDVTPKALRTPRKDGVPTRIPQPAFHRKTPSHDLHTRLSEEVQLPTRPVSVMSHSTPTEIKDPRNARPSVLMTSPITKVVVTASSSTTTDQRTLRGPRAAPKQRSSRRRSALGELSNSPPPAERDSFSPGPTPRGPKRHTSQGSRSSMDDRPSKRSHTNSLVAGPRYAHKENHSRPSKSDVPSPSTARSRQLLTTAIEHSLKHGQIAGPRKSGGRKSAPQPPDLTDIGRHMLMSDSSVTERRGGGARERTRSRRVEKRS